MHIILAEGATLQRAQNLDPTEDLVVEPTPWRDAMQMAVSGEMIHAQHVGLLFIALAGRRGWGRDKRSGSTWATRFHRLNAANGCDGFAAKTRRRNFWFGGWSIKWAFAFVFIEKISRARRTLFFLAFTP